MLAIAAAILLTDGRPVFFRQQRIGLGEQPFTLYKYRTMRAGLQREDARITPLGNLLRRYSLDELPSLLNILCGDMSFIGPRPLLPQYLPYYTPDERMRHQVRPGLTGLAQINGRNRLPWDERFLLDIQYVRSISFTKDMHILLRTVCMACTGKDVAIPGQTGLADLNLTRAKAGHKQ